MGRRKKEEKRPEDYEPSDFISSGSVVLNLALSGRVDGGWKTGRICNIVGDKATGKTLLAIEAAAYVLKVLGEKKKQRVKVVYDETEAAFDKEYAKSLGLPVEDVKFRRSATIEEWHDYLDELIEEKDHDLILYILDSLDAISTKQDSERDLEDGTYGTAKAKMMGEFFRRLASKIDYSKVLLMIVSQERDKIGIKFGKKTTRSGGRALDFYASQIIWLHNKGQIKKSERAIGVDIRAKAEKNKVYLPYREADFPILFSYGIDDIGSMIDFLVKEKVIKKAGSYLVWEGENKLRESLIKIFEGCKDVPISLTRDKWNEIEESIKPDRIPKY